MKGILIPLAVGAAASFVADKVYDMTQQSTPGGVLANYPNAISYLSAGLVVLVAHHFTKAA